MISRRALSIALSLSALFVIACEPPPKPRVKPSKPAVAAPIVRAADGLIEVDGPQLLTELRKREHKATLLNVWASWCGSCKRELPMLIGLQSALASENVGLMLVTVDKPEARPAAVELLESFTPRPSSFIVRGSIGAFKRAINPAWKGALPATALFDARGQLVYFWPGPIVEHEITNVVSALLAGESLEGIGPTLVEPDPPPQ
jgi:thiol-disulfide isomerase/thioredoxin